MKELKPCPFCGNAPEMWTDNAEFSLLGEDEANARFMVRCIYYKCGVRTKWQLTQKEAVEAWNRRVNDG